MAVRENFRCTQRLVLILNLRDIRILNYCYNKFFFFFFSYFICVIGDFHWPMFNFFGSCCIDCRVWFRKWSRLLDCEKLMGNTLGNEWLYSHAEEQ